MKCGDQALASFVISRWLRQQEFEGDRTLALGDFYPINNAHAALAELLEDPVVGDGLTNHFSRPALLSIATNCGSERTLSQTGST